MPRYFIRVSSFNEIFYLSCVGLETSRKIFPRDKGRIKHQQIIGKDDFLKSPITLESVM